MVTATRVIGTRRRSGVPLADLEIIHHPSPNFGPRRDGLTPYIIVLHYTAMASAEAALRRLCDPEAEVSSHYLIGKDGTLWRLVDEAQRAWHAGVGSWRGQSDINSRSIGIELNNDGATPFAEPLMQTLEGLLPRILQRWAIAPENVIGHSDMAPGRKHDPGPHFDWSRLAAQNLAQEGGCPAPAMCDEAAFRAATDRIGYPQTTDFPTLLAAARLRWRPEGSGPLAAEDFTALPVFSEDPKTLPEGSLRQKR